MNTESQKVHHTKESTEKLLELSKVSAYYGGLKALNDVSLSIDEGEIVALMGPNGAGKSTVLKTIFGLLPIKEGNVRYHGRSFKPQPHEVVHMGISFVPQGRQVFTSLTVEENLEMGGIIECSRPELKRRMNEVMDLFPVLRKKRGERSGHLSGGEQQMLALARGLMNDPKVLLLDEPSLGLSPKLVTQVFEKIKEINQIHKTAIFVVEHNIKSLLKITDRAYILDKGSVVAEGDSQELISSGILSKVFLGTL